MCQCKMHFDLILEFKQCILAFLSTITSPQLSLHCPYTTPNLMSSFFINCLLTMHTHTFPLGNYALLEQV